MRILQRGQGAKGWKIIESAEYRGEAELQRLLNESPSLIPIDDIREGVSPLVVAVREFGLPGSGSTDLLCFNADGDIAIVECKLAANAEIKRKVIGQILEYAAYLWRMSYEELDQRIQAKRGKPLTTLVGDAVASSDWDEENFRSAVQESLKKGSFILLIAVDTVNEELSRTISFLNGCGAPEFSFCALEMRRFESDAGETLVPHVHGAEETRAAREPSSRRRWTEPDFFADAQKLPTETLRVVTDLYEWSKAHAASVGFGTGAANGSFTFYFEKDSKRLSVFSVFARGTLCLNYGYMSGKVDKSIIEEFAKSIRAIPSLKNLQADLTKSIPSVSIADIFVKDSRALDTFKKAVTWLGESLR
jgi:hypothetical protein